MREAVERGGGVRYTVLGRWRGAHAKVVWQNGAITADPRLLDELYTASRPGDDTSRLGTALELIGRCMDEVDRLVMDDGEEPWIFSPRRAKRGSRPPQIAQKPN